jgi:hypothetical protein
MWVSLLGHMDVGEKVGYIADAWIHLCAFSTVMGTSGAHD